jgi:hypothetical protein
MPWAGLAALLLLGTVLRLILAVHSNPNQFDTQSFLITADALRADPLQVYDSARFPYPPVFLPWLWVATSQVKEAVSFEVLLRLPMILADAALALLVQDFLGRRGASATRRLLAAGLVALGPVFLAVSGYHGQIDSLAILPAVAALWVWERGGEDRDLVAGALIGIGAATKTVPVFLLVVLLPWARSRRELVRLVVPALGIPLFLLLPFLVANGPDTVHALRTNRGIPGFNGVSLLMYEPSLASFWRDTVGFEPKRVVDFLTDIQQALVLVAVAATAVLLWLRRTEPVHGAVILWLAILAANPNPAWHYLVWGLPFFIMAGHLVEVAVFQAIAAVPLVLFYQPDGVRGAVLDWVYTPLALALYAALVVALVLAVRAVLRGSRSSPRLSAEAARTS